MDFIGGRMKKWVGISAGKDSHLSLLSYIAGQNLVFRLILENFLVNSMRVKLIS